MAMTHEERAFRRGYQQAYEAAIVDVINGAKLEHMRRHARTIQDWRHTPSGFVPPPEMPHPRRQPPPVAADIDARL